MRKNIRSYPDFSFENKLWKNGLNFAAGCDEVGRGCFAGPVVAGVCVFSKNTISTMKGLPLQGIRINDSKKLTAFQREKANSWIKKNCLAWGIGVGSVAEINKRGIVKATNSAFRRAISDASGRLRCRIEYLLIDAFYIPYVRGMFMPSKSEKLKNRKIKEPNKYKFCGNQLAIVNGDQKSISIAAASIIAKVYRDNIMKVLSDKYNKYGWDKNKGYGTKAHQGAIINFGMTKHHRKTFVESFLLKRGFAL